MIQVAFLPEQFRVDSRSDVIVVDTLRASTTIITAFESGAERIIPVASIEEAHMRAADFPEGEVLLAGERGGLRIEGFDLGNSPYEFSPRHVYGKTIIMATTNGTHAIQHCADARSVTIGSLLNARSVAERYTRKQDEPEAPLGQHPVIVCAGTDGKISQDDLIGAGSIVDQLRQIDPGAEIDDAGLSAHDLFLAHKDNLEHALARTTHGRRLLKLGFENDIVRAAILNGSDIVPERNEQGELRAGSGKALKRELSPAETGT